MKNPSRRAIEQLLDTYGVPLLMADTDAARHGAFVRFEMARRKLFREARA